MSVAPSLRLSGRVADPFPLRRMVSRGVLLWLGVLNPVAWVAGWVTVFVRQWFFRDQVSHLKHMIVYFPEKCNLKYI